jgi:hypothetical protein
MAETETSGRAQGFGWIGAIARRWPTFLAIALATVSLVGGPDTEGLGNALLIPPLGYLLLAKLEIRRFTWLVAIGVMVAMTVIRALDLVSPSTVLAIVALIVLVWGYLSKRPQDKGMFTAQAIAMVVFGGLALIALAVDPDLGRYLVAAGWFFHGVWDYIHLKLDRVVSRSFAEWCGLFDILVAVILVFQL